MLGRRNAQHFHTGFTFQGADLVRAQVTGHVGVTLLDQQTARGRVRDVFDNDAFKLRRAARGAVIGFQHNGLMRLIDAHFVRAAARRVHLQPCVAEIVVFHIR
ncbi:hypothetical protein D3C87_1901910 [compost metagenome]